MGDFLNGGSSDNKDRFSKVAIPDTPQQRQQQMLDKFYAAFGGGGANPQIGNKNFQQSLSGYYNNQPFQDIANNFSKVNTFQPRAQFPNGYKLVPNGGGGNNGLDTLLGAIDPINGIMPGAGSMFNLGSLF